MIVRLDPTELWIARKAGVARRRRALALGLGETYGSELMDGEALMIDGAITEMAVAKALGLYWRPLGHLPAEDVPDVGSFDVRSTIYANPHLRLRPKDPDDRETILVWDRRPEFELVGWILNADAKNDQWWGDKWRTGRGESWEVPGSELRPVAELLERAGEVMLP